MRSGVAADLHPLTWVAWLLAAGVVITLTRNPLYLLMLLFGLAFMVERLRAPGRSVPIDPLIFAGVAAGLGGLFNLLTSHYGATVLVQLPATWPLIGGALTAEALAYGVINGLALGTLVAAFSVFGVALPVGALLSLVPRAFYPLAVVLTIAVTYVPLTLRHARQVREAQALRGLRIRSWRDTLPLLLPLLIGGLERALQLAEALAARGFAADPPPPATRLVLAGGLVAIIGGLLLRFAWVQPAGGMALIGVGSACVIASLALAGRSVPRTHYRRYAWRGRDALVIGGAGLAVTALAVWGPTRTGAAFTPYPLLQPPPFALWFAAGLTGLLVPALFQARPGGGEHAPERPEVYR